MKVLLIKAPLSTAVKLEKMEKPEMEFFFGHDHDECVEITTNQDIDLVIAFMRFPDPEL